MPSDYHIHLQRVLRDIEDNLTGDMSLEGCAAAAGYSLFHFHRIFRMVFGLPPGESIRRRRLSVAAELMVESGMNLDSVAGATGFRARRCLFTS